ncbi:isocitrate lyase/PEP mutase family protein [Cognatishimia activa]|uniref:isocitrate lyase/PEP mutase family protein n=1 Tax=Cognatishimia activa TaxID=1715691 RepID=UPI002230365D|nr:isocitrate lyase/phosphoenolpyruvate mutase family protein [Cognatishimia activa]UZD90887.1 isocitrate lyase/phosphoenolpyruvate mutase family protein [Cognatishimia activa]
MTNAVSKQAEKAQIFTDMHQPGDPLVLYNIWDAGSAKVIEEAGARAVATGSWSVAGAQGFDDGEKLPLEIALMTARRICQTVEVPVTLDFEGAYAVGPTGVASNITLAMKQGIVGINFEDQMIGSKGLHKLEEQSKRIAAAREASEAYGVPLFINARTDLFLKEANQDWHAGLMPQALERLEAYTAAGASGFFVPGLTDPELIARVCEASDIPVNVMTLSNGLSVAELADLGVARISHGPGPFRQAMRDLATRFVDTMS